MVVLLVLFAKSAGKIWMECVYTRGYEICVFGISIPLRVYQRERRMTSKLFLRTLIIQNATKNATITTYLLYQVKKDVIIA